MDFEWKIQFEEVFNEDDGSWMSTKIRHKADKVVLLNLESEKYDYYRYSYFNSDAHKMVDILFRNKKRQIVAKDDSYCQCKVLAPREYGEAEGCQCQ